MPPTVSINLCCYNGEKYLREAIDSIINQTYKDWELVIINDGSTDSTEAIIGEYIDRGYPIVYHYQENHGLGYSRNEALKRSRGEFIAFIDQDDIWLPEKLEKQIPLFYGDSKIAIVASNAIQFNEKGAKALHNKKIPKTGYVFRELLGNNFICLPTAIIRRSALNDLNEWFDPRFRHIEEAELFTRLAYTLYFDYVDELLTKNRIHKESSSFLRPELSPKETEMMINKFIKLFPDFEAKYSNEIMSLSYNIQYYYGLLEWKEGNNKSIRRRVKPYLFKKPKAIIPYILSFLPYIVYSNLLYYYRKYLRRIPVLS